MRELILTFEWDGKTVHKETKGFTGGECLSKTKFIDEALGTAGEVIKKSEYYEKEQTKNQAKVRN